MAFNVTVTPIVQDVEVSANVTPYEVDVVVNQDFMDYVAEAKQAAQSAEEDRIQTGEDRIATGGDRVQTGQDRAQTGLDRIATGQDRTQTGLDRIATQSDRVATGEDAEQTALDRIATGQDRVQTGLDRVATGEDAEQTALDRIATGQDRTQTGLDRIATGADRVQTGLDADQTEADRIQTGLDRTATAADRVQTGLDRTATAADRVQTGLDRTAAATSASQAASSAATITNQVSFTGAQNGDLLLRQSGVFSRINQTEFLRSKVPFEKSPLGFFFGPKSIIAWDRFDRADENPVTVSDSGDTYTAFSGTALGRVASRILLSNAGGSTLSFPTITFTATKNIGVQLNLRRTTAGVPSGIIIHKDSNNFIFFGRPFGGILGGLVPASQDYVLYVVIAGVATLLGTITDNSIFGGSGNDGFDSTVIRWVIRYGNRGRNNASRILISLLENPALRIEVDMTTYNTTFTQPSDYNKLAVIATNDSRGAISGFCVANLNL